MQKNDLGQRLRALATDEKKRSKTARLRDVFNDVEAALRAGVTRATVLEELKAGGLVMSLATFETTLKRLRQRQSKPGPTNPYKADPKNTDPVDIETPSHNPADLDAIIKNKPDLAALAKFAKRKPK